MTPGHPAGAETISEEEQRRIDAFLRLTRLERGLRDFIERELRRADGRAWKKALPSDVREKVDPAGMEFANFPDLKKIIGSAWKKFDLPAARVEKQQVLVHLEGLESVRNDIAHSRNVTEDGLALIRAAYHICRVLISPTDARDAFPPTNYPLVALERVEAAVGHSLEIDEIDLRTLRDEQRCQAAYSSACAYARVRKRPGRSPDLMKQVQEKATSCIAEARASIEGG